MVFVDTSVWIDFFAGRDTAHAERLVNLIDSDQDLCVCGVVMTEVLQGIREDREYRKTKAYLGDLIYLDLPRKTYLAAADIYRTLRGEGVTIRNTVDCLIAAICMEHDAILLHNDRDFEAIAKRFPLTTMTKARMT
jgi:predicted nucleic acid-binding protein